MKSGGFVGNASPKLARCNYFDSCDAISSLHVHVNALEEEWEIGKGGKGEEEEEGGAEYLKISFFTCTRRTERSFENHRQDSSSMIKKYMLYKRRRCMTLRRRIRTRERAADGARRRKNESFARYAKIRGYVLPSRHGSRCSRVVERMATRVHPREKPRVVIFFPARGACNPDRTSLQTGGPAVEQRVHRTRKGRERVAQAKKKKKKKKETKEKEGGWGRREELSEKRSGKDRRWREREREGGVGRGG